MTGVWEASTLDGRLAPALPRTAFPLGGNFELPLTAAGMLAGRLRLGTRAG